jgi:beta-1,4-N-acetylglucosaminyltransferase
MIFKSKKKVIVFLYGVGGHRAQMIRLLDRIKNENHEKHDFIAITEYGGIINELFLKSYEISELRSKYKSKLNFFRTLKSVFLHLKLSFIIILKYNVILVVSTGPGIAIVPSYMFKLFNSKIVFIESWSRFEKSSFAGKFIYPIANLFLIQNKELTSVYPKSKYSGRL